MKNPNIRRICFRLSKEMDYLMNNESCFSDEEKGTIEDAFYEILEEEFESLDYVESDKG